MSASRTARAARALALCLLSVACVAVGETTPVAPFAKPLVGLASDEAQALLEELGFNDTLWYAGDFQRLPSGWVPTAETRVVWQDPLPRAALATSDPVKVLVAPSALLPTLYVTIPDFSGDAVSTARARAAAVGLSLEFWSSETTRLDPSAVSPGDKVFSNHSGSAPGLKVEVGSTVGVIILLARPV